MKGLPLIAQLAEQSKPKPALLKAWLDQQQTHVHLHSMRPFVCGCTLFFFVHHVPHWQCAPRRTVANLLNSVHKLEVDSHRANGLDNLPLASHYLWPGQAGSKVTAMVNSE